MSNIRGINNPNYRHGKYIKQKNICIDCKKIIKTTTRKTIRCRKCYIKWLKIPINNPRHKHGKYCTKHFCKCGIEISPIAKRCGNCYGKWRSINIRGNKIAAFIDGKSHDESYPSEFSYYLKEQIRKRDSYTCQLCNINETKFKKNHRKGLEVHHIDYDKENCNKNNLITLCGKCNKKVNYNRDYWFAYFTYLMENLK